MNSEVRCIFRVFRDGGDLIALFPDIPADFQGNCLSYQRIGQHGTANYFHVMKMTKAAVDYKSLQNELESIGYNLKVRCRK